MLTHIAFYKFIQIQDIPGLQSELLSISLKLNLKGTVILAEEGVNASLVGNDENIQKFLEYFKQDGRFSTLGVKKSSCIRMPFRRMIVKIKKEIIPMSSMSGVSSRGRMSSRGLTAGSRHSSMDPAVKPRDDTQYINALELKSWLDNHEEFILIDVRNDYEIEVGTFRTAINPNLQIFRDFPKWIEGQSKKHPDWKTKKVVTYCTGGIRCEKASAFMKTIGFEDVYQLEGGILKYFDETYKASPSSDNHFEGECFVFDYRVALDKELKPTTKYTICYNCWNTLLQDDLKRPEFKQNISCHFCVNL